VPEAWRPQFCSGVCDWTVGVLPGAQPPPSLFASRPLALPAHGAAALAGAPAHRSRACRCGTASPLSRCYAKLYRCTAAGPQADPDYFTPDDIRVLYSTAYKVHHNS
jgi:hypothetical protein